MMQIPAFFGLVVDDTGRYYSSIQSSSSAVNTKETNMPIWSIYEINSCRYKAKKFGGSAVNFCSACFKIDGINENSLRTQLKSGDIQLEGSCERLAASTGANPAAGTAQDATRKRKQRVPLAEIQEPTVKLHFERAKPGSRKSKKRGWSVEESKQAADVIKRTITKGRTMKADKQTIWM